MRPEPHHHQAPASTGVDRPTRLGHLSSPRIRPLWPRNKLACALVVWRLYASSLHRTYRLFFAYVMLQLARSVVLLPLSSKGVTYYRIWVITQPLLWLLYVLVVFELYSLVWKQYRGIYSLG